MLDIQYPDDLCEQSCEHQTPSQREIGLVFPGR